MTVQVGTQAEKGAKESIKRMQAVESAGDNLDDANTFAKLIKKAEEVAQAAV